MNESRVQNEDDQQQKRQDAESDAPEAAPENTLRALGAQTRELFAYSAHYLTAKADSIKLSVRRAVVLAILGVVALVIAAAALVTAAALLVVGAALGIGALLGGRAWAGDLIVGIGVLGLVALGAWIGMRMVFKSSARKTVQRYEHKLQQQRVQLAGHDAHGRSREHQERSAEVGIDNQA